MFEAKNMNKLPCILFLITILSIFSLAQENDKDKKSQEKPNFNGTWFLDEERSYSSSKDRENISGYKVIITHIGEEIKIYRSYIEGNNKNSYTEILYTDKRGEKNLDRSGITGQAEIKSKTRWKKDSIFRSFQYDKSASGLPAYIISSEKYSLSKDGKELFIVTDFILSSLTSSAAQANIRQNGYSAPQFKLIFNKQE